MKVAIVGSRSIGTTEDSIDFVKFNLDMLRKTEWTTIISGGAKGVDTVAREWAEGEKLDFVLYKPYHLVDTSVAYQPRYYFTRNKQIVDNADEVVVIWDGKSNGTRDVIRYAQKRHKPLHIIELEEGDTTEE